MYFGKSVQKEAAAVESLHSERHLVIINLAGMLDSFITKEGPPSNE